MSLPSPFRPRVVIVDDHAGFRSQARATLDAGGYEVVGDADSGAAALDLVRDLAPDVILVDIVLPDLDGFALCELILDTDVPSPPAVVLTSSRASSTYGKRVAQSRARGFIDKMDLDGATLAAVLGSLRD